MPCLPNLRRASSVLLRKPQAMRHSIDLEPLAGPRIREVDRAQKTQNHLWRAPSLLWTCMEMHGSQSLHPSSQMGECPELWWWCSSLRLISSSLRAIAIQYRFLLKWTPFLQLLEDFYFNARLQKKIRHPSIQMLRPVPSSPPRCSNVALHSHWTFHRHPANRSDVLRSSPLFKRLRGLRNPARAQTSLVFFRSLTLTRRWASL